MHKENKCIKTTFKKVVRLGYKIEDKKYSAVKDSVLIT